MSAPITLAVEVDRDEYSRFEEERSTVYATVTPTGQNLSGEKVTLELRKARRARDEIVATKTLTLTDSIAKSYQLAFDLTALVDSDDIPLIRRGKYFIHAVSSSNSVVDAESSDFFISLITVARLKADYLHGTDQFATNVLTVLEQPVLITGVTVEEVSLKHPQSWSELSYNFSAEHVPTVLGVTSEPFSLANNQTLVVRLDGGTPTIVTFNSSSFVDIAAATAAEVAAAITTAGVGLTGTVEGGHVRVTGGSYSLLVDPAGTATTMLGLLNQVDAPPITRLLSWCGGASQAIEPGVKMYTLRRGDTAEYIRVRIQSLAALPLQSHAEQLLVTRTPLTDARMRQLIEEAISWVEDNALSVYVEPTRIVTEVNPDAVTSESGSDVTEFVGATWDKVVDALTYTAPTAKHWLNFKFPYLPVLRFDQLYGKLSNVRIVNIALEWVETHAASGWVELVPFNQGVVFNFIGLVWVESLRGPVPLPNFWNFEALVGFRKTPQVLLELIAKKAAVTILTIAGQAFRPGFASQSVSRDGVSESVSYTQSAQAGIFGATIKEYNDWIKDNLVSLRGAFRGPNMVVA